MRAPYGVTFGDRDDLGYRIDPAGIHRLHTGAPRAYADSSAGKGLTLREAAWFSADMTQRSIHRPHNATAHCAARRAAIAQIQRIDHFVLNVALVALVVVVVVLITPFTGAG